MSLRSDHAGLSHSVSVGSQTRLDPSWPKSETVLGRVQGTVHPLIPLQQSTIALQSLSRMVCVQMTVIPVVSKGSGRDGPSSGSHRRYTLLDVAALGGVLLVMWSHRWAPPQGASPTPGSLWLSKWHFILLFSQHM